MIFFVIFRGLFWPPGHFPCDIFSTNNESLALAFPSTANRWTERCFHKHRMNNKTFSWYCQKLDSFDLFILVTFIRSVEQHHFFWCWMSRWILLKIISETQADSKVSQAINYLSFLKEFIWVAVIFHSFIYLAPNFRGHDSFLRVADHT